MSVRKTKWGCLPKKHLLGEVPSCLHWLMLFPVQPHVLRPCCVHACPKMPELSCDLIPLCPGLRQTEESLSSHLFHSLWLFPHCNSTVLLCPAGGVKGGGIRLCTSILTPKMRLDSGLSLWALARSVASLPCLASALWRDDPFLPLHSRHSFQPSQLRGVLGSSLGCQDAAKWSWDPCDSIGDMRGG